MRKNCAPALIGLAHERNCSVRSRGPDAGPEQRGAVDPVTILDHGHDAQAICDPQQWIAAHDHKIGQLAGFDSAQFGIEPLCLRAP